MTTETKSTLPTDEQLWVVLDENGSPEHVTIHKMMAEDHITDAIYKRIPAGLWTARRVFLESEILQFIGWLSGDIPELHHVEIPFLASSWERFKNRQVQETEI